MADAIQTNIQEHVLNNEELIQHPLVEIPQITPVQDENSTLPFMQDLLVQTARALEEKRRAEQLVSAVKHVEQHYSTKAEDYDPTSQRATQRVREALLDRVDMTLSLEFNKKNAVDHSGAIDHEYQADVCKFSVAAEQASFAAINSHAIGDNKSATMRILTNHHLCRIIAGAAQQRREMELLPPEQRGILGKEAGSVAVHGSQSKKKLAENAKTIKLIQSKDTANKTTTSNPQQTIIAAPVPQTQMPSAQIHKQQQNQIQIAIFAVPFTSQSSWFPVNQFAFTPNQSNTFIPNQFSSNRGGFGQWKANKRDRRGRIYPYNDVSSQQGASSNQSANQFQQSSQNDNKLL